MAPSRSELRVLLPETSIDLDATATSRDDAIRQVGALLVSAGSVDSGYVDQMLDRERTVSTFVGDGVAMPHGTLAARNDVLVEGLALLRLANPIAWGDQQVAVVIGIAAHGRRYITLLSQLASALLEEGRAESLRTATTVDEVYQLLAS
jgi:PTS system mannitol-specific IIA component